jgi:hypothetical protein
MFPMKYYYVFVTQTFVESLCNQFFQKNENEIIFVFYSIDTAVVHLKQTNIQINA